MNTIEKETHALELVGHSFAKLPRRILARVLSGEASERALGRLHALLYLLCFYKEGTVWLDGRSYRCKRGEFIGKQINLAVWAEIKPNSVRYFLRKLEQENLIRVQALKGGTRIYVYGYDLFNQQPEQPETADEVSLEDALASYMEDLNNGKPRY